MRGPMREGTKSPAHNLAATGPPYLFRLSGTSRNVHVTQAASLEGCLPLRSDERPSDTPVPQFPEQIKCRV